MSLSLFVPLPAHAIVHGVSSLVSLKDTTTPPAPTLPREKDFRHVYTNRQKVLASEPVQAASSSVKGLHPRPSVPSSDFDIPIALRKGKWSCTDHLISHFVSYDRLAPSFRQLHCFCPLYLYPGRMRRLY